MDLYRFKSICYMLFGRSWQSQVADYLMISRKTVSSWIERNSVPLWVQKEIQPLVLRRFKQCQFALESFEMTQDDFYHNLSILNAKVFYYDIDRYNFIDVQHFIQNQKLVVLEDAKNQIRDKYPLQSILDFVENSILSEDDISSHLQTTDLLLDEISEIQNLRSDMCRELLDEVKFIYDRINSSLNY